MTAIAMNTAERTRRLFDEADVSVWGNVSGNVRRSLIDTGKMADAAWENAMIEEGMYSDYSPTDIFVENHGYNGNGLLNGYTNGKKIGINEAVVPGTMGYEEFIKTIKFSDDPISGMLRDIYSTRDGAYDALKETIYHEDGHNKTQLKKLKTKWNTSKRTFVDAVRVETRNYISDLLDTSLNSKINLAGREYTGESLKNEAKLYSGNFDIKEFLAAIFSTGPIEGSNQLTTENVMKNKSNYQIHREKKENGITTYDKFTEAAAYALDKMGFDNGLQFYRSWIDNPGIIKTYIRNFFEYSGQGLPQNRTIQMVPGQMAA